MADISPMTEIFRSFNQFVHKLIEHGNTDTDFFHEAETIEHSLSCFLEEHEQSYPKCSFEPVLVLTRIPRKRSITFPSNLIKHQPSFVQPDETPLYKFWWAEFLQGRLSIEKLHHIGFDLRLLACLAIYCQTSMRMYLLFTDFVNDTFLNYQNYNNNNNANNTLPFQDLHILRAQPIVFLRSYLWDTGIMFANISPRELQKVVTVAIENVLDLVHFPKESLISMGLLAPVAIKRPRRVSGSLRTSHRRRMTKRT
ncbi:hypothetical protein V1522DRAFT_76234 [Lipomyces starkeyi]